MTDEDGISRSSGWNRREDIAQEMLSWRLLLQLLFPAVCGALSQFKQQFLKESFDPEEFQQCQCPS